MADLRLSNYLVAAAPTPDMSFQDIVLTAMKKEETAHALYTRLAEQSDSPAMETAFLKLASEEAKHKLHFETIYDDEVLTENRTKADSQKVHNPTVCALFPVAATLAVAHPEAGSSPNGT